MLQVLLNGFQNQIGVAMFVPNDRLAGAIQRRVNIGVDEPRSDDPAATVDDVGIFWYVYGGPLPHGYYAVPLNQQGTVHEGLSTVSVDDGCTNYCGRCGWALCHCRFRNGKGDEQETGCDECRNA
jgi:hypothetical protein